jgi:outer membrane protein W
MKNSLIALAAVATLASGAAFAGEADPSGQFALQIEGARTRAEVKAEAVAAVQSGATRPSAIPASSKVQEQVKSTLDARAVRAQAAEAVRLGQIAYGERSVF